MFPISATIRSSVGAYYTTQNLIFRHTSNIRLANYLKLEYFPPRLVVVFAQSIEARSSVENEDVVGAVPTGDAPTTSGWSTILLSTIRGLPVLNAYRYLRNSDISYKIENASFGIFGKSCTFKQNQCICNECHTISCIYIDLCVLDINNVRSSVVKYILSLNSYYFSLLL